jgi:hypothetical protein
VSGTCPPVAPDRRSMARSPLAALDVPARRTPRDSVRSSSDKAGWWWSGGHQGCVLGHSTADVSMVVQQGGRRDRAGFGPPVRAVVRGAVPGRFRRVPASPASPCRSSEPRGILRPPTGGSSARRRRAEIAQLVEHATENRGVASSNLALGTNDPSWRRAEVAQLVEHHLAKVRVAGSSPVFRSTPPDARYSEPACRCPFV